MNLYLTADVVGLQSGGGRVTAEEAAALKGLGPCGVIDRKVMEPALLDHEQPWCWDRLVEAAFVNALAENRLGGLPADGIKLAHVYAGTFTRAVYHLRKNDTKVTYTAAAHDVAVSRREHERLGFQYSYPHLTVPELWSRYLGGYLAAEVLVCPSQHSANVMRGFGARNRIEVIPHGVDLPRCRCAIQTTGGLTTLRDCSECDGTGLAPIAPLPAQFRVGYLGAYGPDKGVVYLLQAWAKLNYADAVLVLGGRDSTSPFVQYLIRQTGARNVVMTGWVQDVSSFYDQVSVYVQPSVTEGFGIEVLEAMAHGRPVLSSTGAGAVDLVPPLCRFPPADVEALAEEIDGARSCIHALAAQSVWRETAATHTWDKIHARYQDVWRSLL